MGPFAYRVLEAAYQIRVERAWNPSIYNIRYIKPIDIALIDEICRKYSTIVTVENGTVTEYTSKKEYTVGIRGTGIPDEYIHQSTQEEQRMRCGLTADKIYDCILEEIEKNIVKKIKKFWRYKIYTYLCNPKSREMLSR